MPGFPAQFTMKFEKLTVGMTVHELLRRKMGNTTLRTLVSMPISIKSIDLEKRTVVASWNGNPARVFYERSVKSWREKPPVLIPNGIGGHRLATREEIKAINDGKKPA